MSHPLPEERKFVIYPELGCHRSGFLTHLALGAEPPAYREDLEAGSFRRGSPPSDPFRGPQPLPAGCQPLANCQRSPAGAWGLSETLASCLACPLCGRLPSCQLLQWHQGKRSPDFLPRCQGSSSRAPGGYFSGAGARGILRLQRESEVCVLDCSSGDSGGRGPGGVATPAGGELGRQAEGRGSESPAPAPASLALRRAALRGPRATARPRAHTRPRDAQAPGARGAGIGCRWTGDPAASLLAGCLLPASVLASPLAPDFTSPAPAPSAPASAPAAPQPGALHSTAYRLTPCMPPGPPAASRVAGQSRCQACWEARARAASSEPQFYSSGKWAAETHVLGSFGKFTETLVPRTKMPGIE